MHGRFSHHPFPVRLHRAPGVGDRLVARKRNRYGDSLCGRNGNPFSGRYIHTGTRNGGNNTHGHGCFHRTLYISGSNVGVFNRRDHHSVATVLPCISFRQ